MQLRRLATETDSLLGGILSASLFFNVPIIGSLRPFDFVVALIVLRCLFTSRTYRPALDLWLRIMAIVPLWSIGIFYGVQSGASAMTRILHVGLYACLIISVPSLLSSKNVKTLILGTYSVCLAVQVLIQIYQFAIIGLRRPFGTLGSPLAPLLAAGIILTVNSFGSKKLLNVLWTAFLMSGLVLTGSRSEWVVVVLCTLVILLFGRRASWAERRTLLISLAFVVFMTFTASPTLKNQFLYRVTTASLQEGTGATRLENWKAAVDLFLSRPVFGAGARGFSSPHNFLGINTPHSLFLMLAAESGLAGLGAWFAFFFGVLRQALKCLLHGRGLASRVGAYVVVELVYSFVGGTSFWGPYGVLFFVMIGTTSYLYAKIDTVFERSMEQQQGVAV